MPAPGPCLSAEWWGKSVRRFSGGAAGLAPVRVPEPNLLARLGSLHRDLRRAPPVGGDWNRETPGDELAHRNGVTAETGRGERVHRRAHVRGREREPVPPAEHRLPAGLGHGAYGRVWLAARGRDHLWVHGAGRLTAVPTRGLRTGARRAPKL